MKNLHGWSRGIHAAGGRCVMILFVLLFAASLAIAQEDLENVSASGLLIKAGKCLSAKDYGAAVPCLTEYLKRMGWGTDPRVMALSQEVRLKLAKLMAYQKDPESAVDYLNQYITRLPLYKPREAYKMLAVNLYELGDFEACISAATNALANPLPQGIEEEKKTVDYETLSKKEMGGFTARQLKRMEKAAEKAGDDLSEGLSGQAPDPEPDYTAEELILLNMTLAEAYAGMQKWEESLEPYRFVIANAEEEERKGYAIMQTVNSLLALKRFDEVKTLVVQLSRTNARYDIRVNMAFMKAAAALSEAGELDSALMLYRMVLAREKLIAYQEIRINGVRRDAGLPEVVVKIVTNATGRVETLFGYKSSDLDVQMITGASAGTDLKPKPPKLIQLEEAVQTLVELPPYEDNLLYQTGRLYAEAGRPWEAVEALDLVAGRDPAGELGQRAFAESLLVLVDPLEEYLRAETQGKQFFATYSQGLGPRMVAYAVTVCYQKQNRWADIKQLLPVIETFVFSDETATRQYEGELYFMQAVADMMLFNYEPAEAGLVRVLNEYPELAAVTRENSTYWLAVTKLFLKKHQEALDGFNDYSKTYPDGRWLPNAVFYSGVCLFGLDQYDEAQARFTQVIESWPDATVYSDACSMRGDLLAAKGGDLLDAAQKDYEKAIATARQPRQDTYAVFQMLAMFDLEQRYQEIVDVAQAYLERRGEEADVAKAAYWIGKTRLAQGKTDEAVDTYLDTVVKYGGDLQQDGVDLIISELVRVSRRMNGEARTRLKERLHAAVDAAENGTLWLRLRVLLAKMDRSEIELGKVLIKELTDLTAAPPPVLAMICDASFAAGDYSRAREILTIFQTRYEESDFMRAAYKLRGYDLFLAGDDEAAMKLVDEAQGLYGTEPDMAWAQLIKGRIELRLGRFDAARKTFLAVFNVRDWRGEPYAEATFRIGEVEEAAGSPRKAFGWYQRVYVQYKSYAKGSWAADGYLASARCLRKLGLENDRRNTYRAMLFDKYVNQLPQAAEARAALGPDEVSEITTLLEQGVKTNLTVTIEAEGAL